VFAVAERFAVVDIFSVHVDIIGQGIAANAFVLLGAADDSSMVALTSAHLAT